MGKKMNEEITPPVSTGNSGMLNIISAGTIIIGNVYTESDFRVDGEIDGEIACNEKLILGKTSRVKGKVSASYVEVFGEVEGSVMAETLEVKSSARIQGDISAQSLEMEPDALFDGTCSMLKKKNADRPSYFLSE
ncbi:cytoskeletal protein CcmA (bactofilin family) [Parabacteroides sp. PFB2-12]|uniref:bactofilin family protein n=1 Tax=unclassified Parabacteroides TaxID=2649774 RepID=UPI00247554A1|nr:MULTISPECIES: polymer-forming cytoskeletal protein [unclassified Parabacteroides]MDH6343601.1 cytoskeletal protein CcmA (bactofilin family) [Parabacteroides sp. PM6-13]MDH6391418.1 cytoskeletal protein CcmA (bactofilin family) [Parabacteroides sp. PFB2-12]